MNYMYYLYDLIFGNINSKKRDPYELEPFLDEILNKIFMVVDNENYNLYKNYFLRFEIENNSIKVTEQINNIIKVYMCSYRIDGEKLFIKYNNYYPWIIEKSKHHGHYNLIIKRLDGFTLNQSLSMILCV